MPNAVEQGASAMAFKAVCACGTTIIGEAEKPEGWEDCPSCGGRLVEHELPRRRTAETVECCELSDAERFTSDRIIAEALGWSL